MSRTDAGVHEHAASIHTRHQEPPGVRTVYLLPGVSLKQRINSTTPRWAAGMLNAVLVRAFILASTRHPIISALDAK